MSAELAARRTAAAAVLSDFQRETGDSFDVDWRDWQVWALRLGQHLQYLLEAAAPVPAGSLRGRDGTAVLTADDVGLVVTALRAAMDIADDSDRAEIAALRFRLGDDLG